MCLKCKKCNFEMYVSLWLRRYRKFPVFCDVTYYLHIFTDVSEECIASKKRGILSSGFDYL